MNKLIGLFLVIGLFVSSTASATDEYTLILKRPKMLRAGGCDIAITMDNKDFLLANGDEIVYKTNNNQYEMSAKWNCKVFRLAPQTYNYTIKFENSNTKHVDLDISFNKSHILAKTMDNVL